MGYGHVDNAANHDVYPDMARTMIGSRLRVLPAVKERTKASGYEGAQFPWEQAFTGSQHRHIIALI